MGSGEPSPLHSLHSKVANYTIPFVENCKMTTFQDTANGSYAHSVVKYDCSAISIPTRLPSSQIGFSP